MKYLTVIILALLLFMNCSSDDESNDVNSEMKIDLVTGVNVRQDEFSEIIQLGNPNVFTDNQFIAYPNPPIEYLNLLSSQNISNVWIAPANANKVFQQTDFNSILYSELYSETLIQSNAQLEFSELNSTNIILNIESLPSGYYRVFVKINGAIYWENIYIGDNNFEMDDLLNYWN